MAKLPADIIPVQETRMSELGLNRNLFSLPLAEISEVLSLCGELSGVLEVGVEI